jgi:two-component system response regulator YesN
MKVLVADDEERVCALICALIDWEGLGLSLVGTAFDGISALEAIKEKRPDLVITDIRMPGLDGLQLIRSAKEVDDHIQFIIISGHRQFDYAQSAIKFGVAEYLLKPIKQIELNQTLLRMKETFVRLQEQQAQSKAIQNQVQQDRNHLKKTSFASFLVSQDTQILLPWYEQWSSLQIGMVGIQGSARTQVSLVIAKKIEQVFSDSVQGPTVCCLHGDVYLLWMHPGHGESPAAAGNQILVDLLKTQTQIFGELRCTLALGIEVRQLADLVLSYRSAKQVLANRLVNGHGNLYQAKAVEEENSAPYVRRIDEAFKQCCAQNSDEIGSVCLALLEEIDRAKEPMHTVLNAFKLSIEHAAEFIKMHAQLEIKTEEHVAEVDQAPTYEDLKKQFCTSMQHLFTLYRQSRESSIAKPIRIAQEYLAQHYQDELLSLEGVSEIVHLNSSYFSALFKKSVGQGFAEYVLDLRIKKAKELLSETNLGIAQIALQVGYHDPKHFTKIFKKTCQIKPIEYRKLYG